MKPFQYLYFIVAHKLKKLVARDRGKVFPFDLTMVPEELGLEKTLYYLEEMDIDFYNPLQNTEKPGIHQRSKITGSIDRSNMQHIMNYVQLLAAIDEQISDVAGITRQREGRIATGEAVTNSQQTIAQSSTITEAVYFYPHDRLWENVLNSLVQCAQSCWKTKSIKKQFVLDDLSIQTLNVTPDSLVNSDFSVFISNSGREDELFNVLKQLAQPLLQNDKATFSNIISIFKGTSAQELERQIKRSEKEAQQRQTEEIQMAQQAQQQAAEVQAQQAEAQRQHEKELQAQKDMAAYERELLKLNEGNEPENQSQPMSEAEKAKIELEKEKLKVEQRENEKDRKSDEKIARLKTANAITKNKNVQK